jgi:hypothetical protein
MALSGENSTFEYYNMKSQKNLTFSKIYPSRIRDCNIEANVRFKRSTMAQGVSRWISIQRPETELRPGPVGFMVDIVALGQVNRHSIYCSKFIIIYYPRMEEFDK